MARSLELDIVGGEVDGHEDDTNDEKNGQNEEPNGYISHFYLVGFKIFFFQNKMKPIYATLDSYNQYMEETRDSVLQCPELSDFGKDEMDGFLQPPRSVEKVEEEPPLYFFDTDLEGSFLDPVVKTHASGFVSGTVDETGLNILVKVRRLSSGTRASLHRIQNDTIGPEVVVLWEQPTTSQKPFSGTLVARHVPFTEFANKMSFTVFSQLLDHEKWGVVVYTAQHPDGEISGFLQETFFM